MCTVTLSYNKNDKAAGEKLAALLATGLFVQVDSQEDLDIDYSDSTLYEVDETLWPDSKEYCTPEELEKMIVEDVRAIYKMKDAV